MPTLGCKQSHLDILCKYLCSYIPVHNTESWRIYLTLQKTASSPTSHSRPLDSQDKIKNTFERHKVCGQNTHS